MKLINNITENFIEILNSDSTIDCYKVERGKLTNSVYNQISELSHGTNCVYFLYDDREPKTDSFKRHIYIGETTNIYNRMIDHDRRKDWWTHVVIFTGDKRKFDETTICALEHLLIGQFSVSNRYDLCNSQGSMKDIEGDYDNKIQYILYIMDFLGYSLEKNPVVKNPDEKQEKQQNEFYSQIDEVLKQLNLGIKYDQMKLYRSYYLYQNNERVQLFALWPSKEAELYIDIEKISDLSDEFYDISNRARGNRKTAIKFNEAKTIKLIPAIVERLMNN